MMIRAGAARAIRTAIADARRQDRTFRSLGAPLVALERMLRYRTNDDGTEPTDLYSRAFNRSMFRLRVTVRRELRGTVLDRYREEHERHRLAALAWIRSNCDPDARYDRHGGIAVSSRGWNSLSSFGLHNLSPAMHGAGMPAETLRPGSIPITIIYEDEALAADEDTDECD